MYIYRALHGDAGCCYEIIVLLTFKKTSLSSFEARNGTSFKLPQMMILSVDILLMSLSNEERVLLERSLILLLNFSALNAL